LVTGTVLTVRSFTSESSVVVALKEGSATVTVHDSTRVVKAGEAVFVKNAAMRVPTAPELQEATSWNDKTLTIANRSLRDVLPQLKSWYGLDIKVLDRPLLDRPVTIQASLDSPREAITAVEQSANLKFGYEGAAKLMVFRDAGAAKANKGKK
jgi:ferric-dicitrate binding protein FerR (iron transport regulator)